MVFIQGFMTMFTLIKSLVICVLLSLIVCLLLANKLVHISIAMRQYAEYGLAACL